jgi:hypothetical protein
MILASRIPGLSERMKAATIRAAQAQQHSPVGAASMTEATQAPERRLVERLERLGNKVALERLAA